MNLDIIRFLIEEQGFNGHLERDQHGDNILHQSDYTLETVKYFVSTGVNPLEISSRGNTTVRYSTDIDVIKYLFEEHGVNPYGAFGG